MVCVMTKDRERERSRSWSVPLGSIVVGLVVVAALGCGSTTHFVSTWKEPSAGPAELAGQKVAVFAISPQESLRRAAEGAMAREISTRGAEGVAGYTVMTTEEARDLETAARKLEEDGFDAVVTLQAVGQRDETYYQPGTMWMSPGYYGTWGGYWGTGWSTVYDPGYLVNETIVTVETMIYDLPSGELIWAGRSETTDPSKVDAFVEDLASALDDELVKTGLLRR